MNDIEKMAREWYAEHSREYMKYHENTFGGGGYITDHAGELAAFAAHVEQQAWVSVEDRLPEVSIGKNWHVMVSDGRYVITDARYFVESYNPFKNEVCFAWTSDKYGNLGDSVTHWRPLPAPPK